MALLDEKIGSLAEAAGWKTPRRDADGAYRVRLEGGLDAVFFSPDERRCVMRAELTPVPGDAAQRDALLRTVAARQAGVCRQRASIVALEGPGQSLLGQAETGSGERLIIYRMLDLDVAQENFAATARDFLNDVAWWKASFGEMPERQDAATLFSMPGVFWGGAR